MIPIAALLFAIHFRLHVMTLAHGDAVTPPSVHCGIATVGYVFEGRPRQRFAYAGEGFEIPAGGSLTLLADARYATYRIGGKELALNVWGADAMGFRHVPLPRGE